MASIPAFLRGRKGGKEFKNTPDTIRSEDTVEVILAAGEGENFGLAEGAKSMLVGGTRLVNTNGEANFSNFQLTEYTGQENPPPIYPALGGFGSPTAASVSSLARGISVVRTGQLTQIDYIDLRFLVQQLHWSNDKGVYPHQLDIRIEYRASLPAGQPWKKAWSYMPPAEPGYVEDSQPGVNVYTNNDTVQDYWGNIVTFEGDNLMLRNDWGMAAPVGDFTNIWINPQHPVASPDAGRPHVWDEGSQSWVPAPGTVDNGTHWTYGSVKFYKNPSTPPPNPEVGDVWSPPDGKPPVRFNGTSWISAVLTSQAAFAYNNQPSMGNANGVLSMRQKITSPTVREVRIPVEAIDVPYEIRVTKISDDTTLDGKYVSEVGWESYEEIVARAMSFPNTHIIHFVGRASDQFNSLPELEGDIKGRLVDVPTNYDPVTRTYAGVWDSTFKKAWTDNGAWCARDFIKNNRYGLSALYPHEVNEANFYNWAQWCDQAVPDNKGGSRPRWTYNDVLDQPRPAKEQANYMAGSCGAKLIDDGSGVWDVLVDRDEPISMIFGPENVVDGEFTYSFTSIQSRTNWIKVGFVNPELNWAIDYRVVRDPDHIAEYGRIPFEYVATGKTNVSEALASARLRLATSTGEYTAVTYRTNRVGKYLYPFKVVGLCDPDMGWGVSGRISEQTGPRQIRLRDAVYLEAGVAYKFVFNRPTVPMTTVTMSVAAGQTGSLKIINFTTDLPADLPEFAQFALESYNNAGEPIALPKAFKILTITPSEDSEIVEITAIEINRSKWAFSDGTGELLPPEEFSDFTGGVPKPRNVKVRPVVSTIGGLTRRSLYVSWDQSANPFTRTMVIEYSRDGNDYVELARSSSEFYEVEDITAGIHSLRLMHVHVDGVRKSQPVIVVHEVGADYRDVPYPINVRLVNEPDAPNFDTPDPIFTWDHGAEDPNFKHYRIKLLYNMTEDPEQPAYWTPFRIDDVGNERTYQYTREKVKFDGSRRSFRVVVHKVDDFGVESPPSAYYAVSNPLPSAPSAVSLTPSMDGFNIRWAPSTERDFGGVRIYMARTVEELALEEDVYTTAELVYSGTNNQVTVQVPESGDYFFVLASYDLYNPLEQSPSTILAGTASVGGGLEDIIDQIGSAQEVIDRHEQQIADIETIYGDTVSAAASAASAAQSASDAAMAEAEAVLARDVAGEQAEIARTQTELATAAKNAAGDEATAANTSAQTAASAATAAGTSAAAANTAKLEAEAAFGDAALKATAANESASLATAKATEAGQQAAAANTAKIAAETAKGAAEIARTDAVTSETNAAGSAQEAATSASLAATARDAAGGHATAANTAAGVASSKATEAENSASAATVAKTAAEAAKEDAGTHASSAATSFSNASGKATEAAGSAAAAAGSATTAATEAGKASTFASQASTSSAGASTAASNAGASATSAAGSATAAEGFSVTASGHALEAKRQADLILADGEGTIKGRLTNVESITSTVDGRTKAMKTVVSDVGGVITGTQSINDGVSTSFKVQTDVFELVPSTGTGRRLHFSNGNIILYDDAGRPRIYLGVNL